MPIHTHFMFSSTMFSDTEVCYYFAFIKFHDARLAEQNTCFKTWTVATTNKSFETRQFQILSQL